MPTNPAIPQSPGFRLDGKRALVTGGSRGIGLACAASLGEQGAELVCVARNKQQLDAAVNSLSAQGFRAQARVCDVKNLDQVAQLFAEGHFDILVNSAGMARNVPALEVTPQDFDQVVQVNLRAAFFLSVHAARAMMKAGVGGSIIHISSQMGVVGGIDRSVYCATKHGLEGMIKAMAIEWGKLNIRINSICPTFIRTELTQPTFAMPERVEWILSKIHLGRIGQPHDIMGAVAFLASDASSLVTGSALKVDGGWTAD